MGSLRSFVARFVLVVSMVVASASGLASCGGGGSPGPTLKILMPASGATIKAGAMYTVQIAVTNFTLTDPFATPPPPNAPDTGHYHVYLDSDLSNYIALGWTETATFTFPATVAPGMHTLTINLRNSDHTEIVPVVQASVPIVVE